MLWLYILLAVAAVISYALFAPVGLRFKMNGQDDTAVYVFYGILRFKLKRRTDEQKAKREEKQAAKKAKKAKKSGKKAAEQTENSEQEDTGGILSKFKEGGVRFILDVFKDIADILSDAGRRVQKHLHLYIKELDIKIANEDPAVTGQLYGYVCAGVYPIINLFGKALRLSVRSLKITPDFMSEEISASCDIRLWILPIFGMGLAVRLIRQGIKLYTKHFASNPSKSPDSEKPVALKG